MDDEDLVPRMGTFFIILGVASIGYFVISDITEELSFRYFFAGLLFVILGTRFRRNVQKPSPSGRFESWRKFRSGELKDEMATRKEEARSKKEAKRQEKQAERQAKKQERKERLAGKWKSIKNKGKKD